MRRDIKSWIENTRVIPEWNDTVGKGVMPREGLKQGCCLSPILCAAFMNAFTASDPQEENHPSLANLRQRASRKEIQGKDWGIQPAFLTGKIACLQFVDDTTLFADSKQEMAALFKQYSSFCRSYMINVNSVKCSVTVFCERNAGGLAAENARLKEATAQRASAPRKQTKAKPTRLATEAKGHLRPASLHGSPRAGHTGEGVIPGPWCSPPGGLRPSRSEWPRLEQSGTVHGANGVGQGPHGQGRGHALLPSQSPPALPIWRGDPWWWLCLGYACGQRPLRGSPGPGAKPWERAKGNTEPRDRGAIEGAYLGSRAGSS